MRLNHPRIGVITLSKSRISAFAMFIFVFLFISLAIFLGWIILGRPASLMELTVSLKALGIKDWGNLVVLILPFLLLHPLLKYLHLAVAGEVITFDSQARTIDRNGEILARFDEVQNLNVAKKSKGEDEAYYLALLFADGREVPLYDTADADQVATQAEELANLLNISERLDKTQLARWVRGQMWSIIFIIVFALGAFIWAAVHFQQTRSFVLKAKSAPGIVVDLVKETGSEGRVNYRTTVRFRETVHQREIDFVTSTGRHYQLQDQVTVLYDPENPEKAQIKGLTSYSLSIILAAAGMVFILVLFCKYWSALGHLWRSLRAHNVP